MTRSLLAVLLCAAAAPVVAQTPPPAAATASSATPAPRPAGRTRAFLDPLGKLWEVPGQDGLEVWFAATDTNHDGFIDRREMAAAAKAWFAVLDLNHDGEIDPDEESAYEADRSGGHGALIDSAGGDAGPPHGGFGGGGPGGGGPGGHRHGHHPGGDRGDLEDRTGALMDLANPVISADLNMDRGVSEAELVSAGLRRLALLDIDGDGKLSLDEARRRRAAQQSNFRERQHVATPVDQQPPPEQ